MRITFDVIGWTLDIHLCLTSEVEDAEGTEKLSTSDHSLVGFGADPAFIDKYPDEGSEE
jgi:hypothetical protein